MDFKVEIRCEQCKCAFELRPKDFLDRESLACPNCASPLPQDIYDHLRSGIKELALVPETIPENSDFFSLEAENQPKFSLRVKEYNTMLDFIS